MRRMRGDAFGNALLDRLNTGEGAAAILEREDGFVGIDDLSLYFSPFRRWPSAERRSMRFARGRVLDVGCAAGRVALHLQERGHEVVAIDVSRGAVEVARCRGVLDARLLSITQVGPSLGVFDSIVMLGNNFGVFGNDNRARMLLRRLHTLASPGARIIAGSADLHGPDDPLHLRYQRSNRRRGRRAGQLRLRIRYEFSVTNWFDFLLVSPSELEEIVEGTGWRLDDVVSSDDPEDARFVGIVGRV